MHPVLVAFDVPLWLARPGLPEIFGTLAVALAWLWWNRRREGFTWTGWLVTVLVYVVLRSIFVVIGPGHRFELHTYGVLVAVGFSLGIVVAARQARREFIRVELVLDLAFWILVAALVGARLMFILVNLGNYVADPLALLKVWTGGLVFYGGFLGAVAASWWFCSKKGIGFFRIADLVIPSVALGHFFGRLGCYCAGCCHGSPTGVDWFGAVYTHARTVVERSGLLGIPLHPAPLYDALGEILAFGVLMWLRPRKRYNGQLLIAWLVIYPLWRFADEMFRGDVERGILVWIDLFGDQRPELLSSSQVVSVLLLVLAGVLWWQLGRAYRSRTRTGTQPAR
ncbi:MAG: prolipoprotein diacylglyceryl transferase [Deltaproteobacteria bacterium]|nr:MAG: prolipoprotein diacylglyceryl transferase [Deltaproteobacteria bacterium]